MRLNVPRTLHYVKRSNDVVIAVVVGGANYGERGAALGQYRLRSRYGARVSDEVYAVGGCSQ